MMSLCAYGAFSYVLIVALNDDTDTSERGRKIFTLIVGATSPPTAETFNFVGRITEITAVLPHFASDSEFSEFPEGKEI